MPPPRSNFCNISAYCLKLATNLPHPKNFQKKLKSLSPYTQFMLTSAKLSFLMVFQLFKVNYGVITFLLLNDM